MQAIITGKKCHTLDSKQLTNVLVHNGPHGLLGRLISICCPFAVQNSFTEYLLTDFVFSMI